MKIVKNLAIELAATFAALLVVDVTCEIIKAVKKDIKIRQDLKEEDERLKKELGDLEIVPKGGNWYEEK